MLRQLLQVQYFYLSIVFALHYALQHHRTLAQTKKSFSQQ